MLLAPLALALPAPGLAQQAAPPGPSPDQRAAAIVSQMTLAEKLQLLHGHYPNAMPVRPPGVPPSAGYIPGIPRLKIPDIRMTNGGQGVDAAGQFDNPATALPSGPAIAASFDPRIAFAGGAVIGREARAKGFGVVLAGGINLMRDPRNGRNFEYFSEDPLLTAIMGGQSVRGIQTAGVASTLKHYVLNAQETGRQVLDARIDEAALRESDLLAFEKAIEIGDPAAVMCAYNKVNGDYACESAPLMAILKEEWGYPGWVMSDWGATHSTVRAARAGQDQEMGEELDQNVWFGDMLAAAVGNGAVPQARVDDMARRVLRGLIANGVIDRPPALGGKPDLSRGAQVARDAAAAGIVLLRNTGDLLPLSATSASIAVIGGYADRGVMSGGGSSQVKPSGSQTLPGKPGAPEFVGGIVLHPSPPLDAIKASAPWANVTFTDGSDISSAVAAASGADIAIVFATQYATEGLDSDTKLDGQQDALIAAVASANPRTIVVLETGGPVAMPWLDRAGAVLEAWYPGGSGGWAIADVLFGRVNPSGHLPMTFPFSGAQLPSPVIQGSGLPRPGGVASAQPEPFAVAYPEGADVGYRWFERRGAQPLFPFGFGLSYTRFVHTAVEVDPATLVARFSLTNTGERRGTDIPQLYLAPPGGAARLVGWAKADLDPGESGTYRIGIDPRFAARFDVRAHQWVVPGGNYSLRLAGSATDPGVTTTFNLQEIRLPANWKPGNPMTPVALEPLPPAPAPPAKPAPAKAPKR